MYTLKVDQPLTRRKTLHHVVDRGGGLVYSSAKVGPCIAWLHLRGEQTFYLEIEDNVVYPDFHVRLEPITPETPDPDNQAEG